MKGRSASAFVGALFVFGLWSTDDVRAADLSVGPLATPYADEPPPCPDAEVWDQITAPPFRHRWCRSYRPGYEARHDVFKTANGRPYEYDRKTNHYDCQNPADYKLIPPVTRAKVCGP